MVAGQSFTQVMLIQEMGFSVLGCSDQGRGGNNLENADTVCLKRTRSRIPRLVNKLQNLGINPEKNIEAFINNLDQWNQASPRVSDAFPKRYADALKKD